MNVYILVGTRPNFIKVTQFKKCAKSLDSRIRLSVIHSGQHYDSKMADVFFDQFNLQPDHFLNISAATPNAQIAEVMLNLEKLCDRIGYPDLMLVAGDVNSTLAGALFANKSGIRLGHIEAGLRSFDRSMPEEFNRVLTDQLSDLFFVTEPSGKRHLLEEGVSPDKIHFVGNTMIDTLVAFEKEIEASDVLSELNLENDPFVLMTMHRPATVDNREGLKMLVELIGEVTRSYKVVFPIHPRTIKNLKSHNLEEAIRKNARLVVTEPLDYFSFQKLVSHCTFIITDSGGIQEESTFRQKPCLTLRPNTERPVTVEIGSNTLLPFDPDLISKTIRSIEDGNYKKGRVPELWDGNATVRIMKVIGDTGA
jgi:UDP-N-acetylglucosamine 2-epimerase (non-hydrolysing)